MALASRQQITQRVAQGIDIFLDFGAEPTPTTPKGLGSLACVFFGGPGQTELAVWVNGVKVSNTTTIPAGLFNSSQQLAIGSSNGSGNILDGRSGLGLLCATNLPSLVIRRLYRRTRRLFRL